MTGVVGSVLASLQWRREVTKSAVSRKLWKMLPQRVKAPYVKTVGLPGQIPEYGGTREMPSESAGTTPQG